jgi:hypothetical protein
MNRRKLLILDFCCALGGAVFYLVAFDFIVGTLGVPRLMVQVQLAANFAYSVYGAVLLLTRLEHTAGFRWLVKMNFAYAALCLLASFYFLSLLAYPGALLLFGEALLIGLLARAELTA